MTRRRWIYPQGGEPFEVGDDFVNRCPNVSGDALLWNDRLFQDDGDPRYHSRKSHAEYMKRNDLAVAGDFTETWQQSSREREQSLKGIDPSRREQIARALQRK